MKKLCILLMLLASVSFISCSSEEKELKQRIYKLENKVKRLQVEIAACEAEKQKLQDTMF
jgi:hypothetical protein